FVAEFNSAGTVIFSTYFGGSDSDAAEASALDAAGNIYFVGQTYSTDFPTLNPLEASLTGSGNAFLAKIDSTGHLVYSTYLGTTVGNQANGVAVDASLNMFITGPSIIVKLNPAGSAVIYTVAGAAAVGGPITVDNQGNAYTPGCVTVDPSICPFLPLV